MKIKSNTLKRLGYSLKAYSREEHEEAHRKEHEEIANRIERHIPYRVADDGLLTPNEKKNSKYIIIPLQKYIDAIRNIGYYQGKTEELEKQLEKLEKPIINKKTAIEEEQIIEFLEGENERLKAIRKRNEMYDPRLAGKIEGIEYALKIINKER